MRTEKGSWDLEVTTDLDYCGFTLTAGWRPYARNLETVKETFISKGRDG